MIKKKLRDITKEEDYKNAEIEIRKAENRETSCGFYEGVPTVREQLYEIETHILLYALKEESSILPLLPQDILNNLQDILKGVQTKTIMAYEIFEEQEKCDFDVEELGLK